MYSAVLARRIKVRGESCVIKNERKGREWEYDVFSLTLVEASGTTIFGHADLNHGQVCTGYLYVYITCYELLVIKV